MKVAGIAGIKQDGSIQGLGIGEAGKILKQYKEKEFVGLSKVYYFDNFGRRISKAVKPAPAKPAPAKPAPAKK